MTRRDPETMLPYTKADGQWFDYDGDEIYGDLSLSYDEQTETLSVTDLMAHEPGLAQYEHASETLHHLHGNLIGTTERMTDAAGSIAHRAVYTAFGEPPVWSNANVGTRYGYAGSDVNLRRDASRNAATGTAPRNGKCRIRRRSSSCA